MRFLVDTQLLLWSTFQPFHLSPEARNLLEDRSNILSFSTASIWELSIKRTLKRSGFEFDPQVLRRALLDDGYGELEINSSHAIHVQTLMPLHKDPFDHLLIAQAQVEGLILLSSDREVLQYGGSIRFVRKA